MANVERSNHNHIEQELNTEAMQQVAEQGRERIAEKLERSADNPTSKRSEEQLRSEALEQASAKHENELRNIDRQSENMERKRKAPTTKREREAAFTHVMDSTRSHMSPAARTFSKVIHTPIVEKASEVASKTIVRPNAILSGSVSAFILVLAVLLIARYYGYPLSGSETIIAFVAGWLIGMLYDLFRAMITGGK